MGRLTRTLIGWLKDRETMPQCDECGHHVTADFHRVFADNQGTLYGCPACMSMTEIKNGNAAGL